MRQFLIFTSIFLMVLSGVHAQQTASQVLSTAERDYEQGKLSGIPERLKPYFINEREGGFNKSEQIRAQKLITLSYVFTDNEAKAEEAFVELLKLDPEHKRDPRVDPAEFYFLYDKFHVEPIFRISLKAGANKSLIDVTESFCTCTIPEYEKYYNGADVPTGDPDKSFTSRGTLGIGFWAEVSLERHLFAGIETGLGLQLRTSRYDVDQKINASPLTTYISNQQLYARTPIYVRYNFRYFSELGAIPYVTAGSTFDILLDARYGEASRQGGTSFSPTDQIKLNNIGINQANPFNISLFGAVGTKIRYKTHFLTFEIRYDKSLFNYIKPSNRTNGDSRIIFDLAYVEDDLTINMVSFSAGYTHSIYWPRKKKEFR